MKTTKAIMTKANIAELFGVDVRTIFNWNALGWMARSGNGYDAGQSVRNVTRQLIAAVTAS